MPSLDLSPVEARILGCLLEKERTVPESYPLTLNSLITACNQTTNREPVTAYDEKTIEAGIHGLREKKLATVVFGAGSRVQKYRHNLPEHFELDRRDFAVMCVLLLRGPQTAGELRSRTERLFHFASLEELEACLESLQAGDSPLVRLLPAQPGQKERRYVQLFSVEPEGGWQTAAPIEAPPLPRMRDDSRLEALEAGLASLRDEFAALKAEFSAFKSQF
ncbi:MAG TPA: YceH family protein [Chthoniobacteraceae bacterium]|jgi:hypothetical protein|nr:YceH family protein [Chthoniobacteraceae bacterium]